VVRDQHRHLIVPFFEKEFDGVFYNPAVVIERDGEQPAHARFYGSSYFRDPRGQIVAQASDREDEVLVADLDLGVIEEVRTTWQCFRDRRPGTYAELGKLLP
jgi:predicted amidohydrolase